MGEGKQEGRCYDNNTLVLITVISKARMYFWINAFIVCGRERERAITCSINITSESAWKKSLKE